MDRCPAEFLDPCMVESRPTGLVGSTRIWAERSAMADGKKNDCPQPQPDSRMAAKGILHSTVLYSPILLRRRYTMLRSWAAISRRISASRRRSFANRSAWKVEGGTPITSHCWWAKLSDQFSTQE
jgi:hypothetical protein